MNYSALTQPVTIIAERILTVGGTTPVVTTETRNAAPGASTIQMALDSFVGATVYAQDANNGRDQAYLGRAFQYFTDQATGGTSSVTFSNSACASGGANSRGTLLLMPGCASLLGTVQQYTGIYLPVGSYTGEVVVLESKGAIGIEFWAKSSIPFRVQVEDIEVHDNDFHGANLPAAPQWTKFDIPFSALSQRGFGTPVPFTGNALQLSWVVPSAVAPANAASTSFDMAIDGVALIVRQTTPVRPPRR